MQIDFFGAADCVTGSRHLVTWGGQRLYVVGHTAGGAPYGVTEEEWNRDDVVVYGPPWELAREVLARCPGA